jgi:protein SCO1/2
MLEKGKVPEKLPFDPLLMGVFFIIALIVTIIVVSLIFKKKKSVV